MSCFKVRTDLLERLPGFLHTFEQENLPAMPFQGTRASNLHCCESDLEKKNGQPRQSLGAMLLVGSIMIDRTGVKYKTPISTVK